MNYFTLKKEKISEIYSIKESVNNLPDKPKKNLGLASSHHVWPLVKDVLEKKEVADVGGVTWVSVNVKQMIFTMDVMWIR